MTELIVFWDVFAYFQDLRKIFKHLSCKMETQTRRMKHSCYHLLLVVFLIWHISSHEILLWFLQWKYWFLKFCFFQNYQNFTDDKTYCVFIFYKVKPWIIIQMLLLIRFLWWGYVCVCEGNEKAPRLWKS